MIGFSCDMSKDNGNAVLFLEFTADEPILQHLFVLRVVGL